MNPIRYISAWLALATREQHASLNARRIQIAPLHPGAIAHRAEFMFWREFLPELIECFTRRGDMAYDDFAINSFTRTAQAVEKRVRRLYRLGARHPHTEPSGKKRAGA